MKQLNLPDVEYPTPVLNDNRGSVDWTDSGCKPTKKLRHENLAELGISEAKSFGEVSILWMPGATNPADIFTKEDNDVAHYCGLRDLMVTSRESFMTLPEHRWGVLKQRSYARDNEESELIPTSLMTRKEKRTKTQHDSWNFPDQDFTIGGGGVEQPIYTYIPVSNE